MTTRNVSRLGFTALMIAGFALPASGQGKSKGIEKKNEKVVKAADKLRDLQERLVSARIDDHSRTFNTELVAALELSCMLDVAESIVLSALRREESRGAHQRTDFPARDDQRFLAHTLVHREADSSSRVEYSPVTITRFPPGERVYGR